MHYILNLLSLRNRVLSLICILCIPWKSFSSYEKLRLELKSPPHAQHKSLQQHDLQVRSLLLDKPQVLEVSNTQMHLVCKIKFQFQLVFSVNAKFENTNWSASLVFVISYWNNSSLINSIISLATGTTGAANTFNFDSQNWN